MEDREIATHYLFLYMAVVLLQLDIQHMQNGPFKIKEIYINQLEKAYSKAINERRMLKQIMWKRKIKIESKGKSNGFTHYMFYYNGKEEMRYFNNYVIRKNVKNIIEGLLVDIKKVEK